MILDDARQARAIFWIDYSTEWIAYTILQQNTVIPPSIAKKSINIVTTITNSHNLNQEDKACCCYQLSPPEGEAQLLSIFSPEHSLDLTESPFCGLITFSTIYVTECQMFFFAYQNRFGAAKPASSLA
ncbi:hypothetical protein ABPG72_020462 [Tetrahymena utriculariae]